MAKIGLVLSGGAAKGLAHIGALRALEQAGIRIDAIAGCSMGSIIGAVYASGKTPEQIEQFLLKHRVIDLLNISISKLGINKTSKLRNAFTSFTGVSRFEQLKIPTYINATDLTKGREAVFSTGEIFPAIRASIAIPGVFAPLITAKRDIYVDGGVLNNLPVDILPRKIKKFILVDVSSYKPLDKDRTHNLANVLQSSGSIAMEVMLRLRLRNIPKNDYVLIRPNIPIGRTIPGRKKIPQIIKSGEQATRKKIPEIRRKLLT